MGGSDNKGDGLASQLHHYRVPGQPLLNQHQVGGVSRNPDGLFEQQEREPIRGRPVVRGKRTSGGRPGQCVEEQGTWASRTHNHSKAGYGRPVDRGTWTAKTVKQPRQQPAHPQYANYWAPLTPKRHTLPHSAQPQHTNDWAPRTRKRHQQEHRPQRPTERSDPTQHAKGRPGDCPGPRKGTTTRRNVTQGGSVGRRTPVSKGMRGLRKLDGNFSEHCTPRSAPQHDLRVAGAIATRICWGSPPPPPRAKEGLVARVPSPEAARHWRGRGYNALPSKCRWCRGRPPPPERREGMAAAAVAVRTAPPCKPAELRCALAAGWTLRRGTGAALRTEGDCRADPAMCRCRDPPPMERQDREASTAALGNLRNFQKKFPKNSKEIFQKIQEKYFQKRVAGRRLTPPTARRAATPAGVAPPPSHHHKGPCQQGIGRSPFEGRGSPSRGLGPPPPPPNPKPRVIRPTLSPYLVCGGPARAATRLQMSAWAQGAIVHTLEATTDTPTGIPSHALSRAPIPQPSPPPCPAGRGAGVICHGGCAGMQGLNAPVPRSTPPKPAVLNAPGPPPPGPVQPSTHAPDTPGHPSVGGRTAPPLSPGLTVINCPLDGFYVSDGQSREGISGGG